MKRGPTEHAQPKDTFTADSGARLVAKVMRKAEATHASSSKTTEGRSFHLERNQAKHVSGDGSDNFGQT
jgi:hypothetical protein